MATKRKSESASIYQIKITLEESHPPIWRRVLVKSSTTLARLHDVIQCAMGWEDYHLHEVHSKKTRYAPCFPDGSSDAEDESRVQLKTVAARAGAKLRYTYDFGDGWRHELKVEKILEPEKGAKYPVCVGGKRACPPEDCGGTWGYYDLLEILGDPTHEQHEEMMEWIGDPFDPDAFDLDEVNRILRSLR